MRSFLQASLIIFCTLVLTQNAAAAAVVTITDLPGGDCFSIGNPITIQWTKPPQADHVAFYFAKNGNVLLPPKYDWTQDPLYGSSITWTPKATDETDSGRFVLEAHDIDHNVLRIYDVNNVVIAPDCKPRVPNPKHYNVTHESAEISWGGNVRTEGVVEYGPTNSYGNKIVDPINPKALALGHAIKLTSLSPGTTYHYRVSSTNADGQTAVSVDEIFTTAPSAEKIKPAPITDFRIDAVTDTTITLKWTSVGSHEMLGKLERVRLYSSEGIQDEKSMYGGWYVDLNDPAPPGVVQTYTRTDLKVGTIYTFLINPIGDGPAYESSPLFVPGFLVTTSTSGKSSPLKNDELGSLKDGDLIRVPTAPGFERFNVWIIKKTSDGKLFRRRILNPRIFNSYRHLKWESIKDVSAEVRDAFKVSVYVRIDPVLNLGDDRVFALTPNPTGADGIKHHIQMTATQFTARVDPAAIFNINKTERDGYASGDPITDANLLDPL